MDMDMDTRVEDTTAHLGIWDTYGNDWPSFFLNYVWINEIMFTFLSNIFRVEK